MRLEAEYANAEMHKCIEEDSEKSTELIHVDSKGG